MKQNCNYWKYQTITTIKTWNKKAEIALCFQIFDSTMLMVITSNEYDAMRYNLNVENNRTINKNQIATET